MAQSFAEAWRLLGDHRPRLTADRNQPQLVQTNCTDAAEIVDCIGARSATSRSVWGETHASTWLAPNTVASPNPEIVNKFFNDSTGVGAGETDARGPWNEGPDVEYVESPSKLEPGVTSEKFTQEIKNASKGRHRQSETPFETIVQFAVRQEANIHRRSARSGSASPLLVAGSNCKPANGRRAAAGGADGSVLPLPLTELVTKL